MAGLVLDVGAIIAQLQQLLRDRYPRAGSELPILKEILQNADDAGASTLHLILFETGLAHAANPLLRGPALICVNDGRFRPEDEEALRTFGSTSKADEAASIGRFGVGQKSVFHLAEAYFFLGRASASAAVTGNVIDPWAHATRGDQCFPAWNSFENSDVALVQELLAPWLTHAPWFVLLLPLRRSAHVRTGENVIEKHFPDPARLIRDLSDPAPLGACLPQLHRVRAVETWRLSEKGRARLCGAQWKPNGDAMQRPLAGSRFERDLEGIVALDRAAAAGTAIDVFLNERCVDHAALGVVRGRSDWPARPTFTREGLPVATPEKAVPHGAVTFLRVPGSDPGLRISWAAYLPLGNTPEVVASPELHSDWRVYLHGYVFPDSGRQGVAGATTDAERYNDPSVDVRHAWNALVRRYATLPSLLRALKAAVAACAPAEGELLAKALARSETWRRCRAEATATGSLGWGPRVDAGLVSSRAMEVAPTHRLLPTPRARDLVGSGGLLSALTSARYTPPAAIVWNDGPRLGPNSDFDAWSSDDVQRAVEALSPALLAGASALDYLDRWVSLTCTAESGGSAHLPGLLRRCFAEAVLNTGALAERWSALAERCPAGAVLWSRASTTLLRRACDVTSDVVILPEKIRTGSGAPPPARLSLSDARRLLGWLQPALDGEHRADAERLITEVVGALGAAVVLADPVLSELRLVTVWSAKAGAVTCIAPHRLRALISDGAAFATRGVVRPHEFGRKLLAAIPSLDDVVLVESEDVATALEVGPFSAAALTRALGDDAARVGELPAREALLSHLTGAAEGTTRLAGLLDAARADEKVGLALRYLVHGAAERKADRAALFEVGRDGAVYAAVLRATGRGWRVISDIFSRRLTGEWRQALSITPLDFDALVDVLEAFSPEECAGLGPQLADDERSQLRVVLARHGAAKLYGALTIHETTGGGLARRSGSVFSQGSWPVPESFRGLVEILVTPNDQADRAMQAQVFSTWDAEAQLRLALRHPAPWMLAQEILSALSGAPGDLLGALRQERWLVATDGRPIAPREIFYLPSSVDRALRDLLPMHEKAFLQPSDVRADLRSHPLFERALSTLALSGREAFQAAALQLERAQAEGSNQLWIIAAQSREAERAFFADGLSCKALTSDPVWAFIRALYAELGESGYEFASDLLNTFRLKPSAARVLGLLSRFVGAGDLDDDPSRRLFEAYLCFAAARPDFVDAILPRVQLLNRHGTWKDASALAWIGTENLRPMFQVCDRHRAILERALAGRPVPGPFTTPSAPDIPAATDASGAEVLREYFSPWIGLVPPEAIGYFLVCLGDGEGGEIARLAEQLLQQSRTAQGARERLFELGAGEYGPELGFCRRARWRFQVVAQGDSLVVASLAGTPLIATVGAERESTLFVGQVPRHREGVAPTVRLAQLDPSTKPAAELQAMLAASLRAFVLASVAYTLDSTKLELFWRQFGAGGAAQIGAVRSLILERLPVYVEELLGARDPLFRPTMKALERSEQRHREACEVAGLPPATVETARVDHANAQAALRALVERDPAAQDRLLAAVREKLTRYQYTADQVLFELFQNADDATRDLEDLEQRSTTTTAGFEVAVLRAPATLVQVRHWGRPINRGVITGRAQQPTDRAFELDLKNMLVLHLSDKDERSTGRFGLGFKSVHLITRRPRVRSGDLSFEVVGGLLPQHVPTRVGLDRSTVFDLPLDDADALPRIIDRFWACAGLLTGFGRAIRRVSLTIGDERTELRWEPRGVDGVQDAEVSEVPDVTGSGARALVRVLLLRGSGAQRTLGIALRLAAQGPAPFVGLPDLWHTAPTGEAWGLGFCLNAPFEVDIGRGRLAFAAAANRPQFAALGRILGGRLVDLARALEERFEVTALALGLESSDPESGRRAFWSSAFSLLTSERWEGRGPDELSLIRSLHGSGGGLRLLVESARTLPTDLHDDHEVLTTLSSIRWVFDEVLAKPRIFGALMSFSAWRDKPVPGTAVSTLVRARLARVGIPLGSAAPLTFNAVLSRALPADTLLTLTSAISCRALINAVTTDFGESSPEATAIIERLSLVLFPSANGPPRYARELLVARDEAAIGHLDARSLNTLQDEVARACFAPDDAVLAPSFAEDPAALTAFLWARQRRTIGNAEEAARWAIAAQEDRRSAVLRYLARGSLARQVLEEIRARGGLPWCSDEQSLLRWGADLGRTDLEALRVFLLGFSAQPPPPTTFDDEEDELDAAPAPPPPRDDAGAFLLRVEEWWRRRGDEWTATYEGAAYDSLGGAARVARDLSADSRDAWLELLTLAACQRFGRQRDAQHAGFIRALRDNGRPRWWEVLRAPAGARSATEWITFLDQWLDGRVDTDQYRHWLGLYPTLYQLHRHGDTYRELLSRAAEHPGESFTLSTLLAPRANPALSGAGGAFDAPPLAPALGIGAPWALRELVRLRVIPRSAHVDRYCYVPRRATRDLLASLGAQGMNGTWAGDHGERARAMFDFVAHHLGSAERAAFGGAFDLPLYLYSTEESARTECGA